MTAKENSLPSFTYSPDPLGNGSIMKKEEICPWCIADGSAAAKWSASFNDLQDVPPGVPTQVALEVETRTPGYESWQGNSWLFSPDDALVFLGEVCGARLSWKNARPERSKLAKRRCGSGTSNGPPKT